MSDPQPNVMMLLGVSTGGIRQHVAELTRRLIVAGWSVKVAGPDGVMDTVGPLDEVVPVPKSKRPDRLWAAARQLRRVVGDAEVIHAHGLTAAAVARLARTGLPVVATVHNLVIDAENRFSSARSQLARRVLAGCDRVIVISPEIDAEVATVVPESRRRYVLPASADRQPDAERSATRSDLGAGEDTPLVVVVARLSPQKDLSTFLRAMAVVHARLPTARAVVVGDGPAEERARLEALRRSLGLLDVVEFVGHRPNPANEMVAADVVALSSVWEGSPVAVVEALRLARPLVTTAVGTVPVDLTDGVDARVVSVGDAQAFADALIDVLTSPADAAAMAGRGQQTARRLYDADVLVGQVADVYLELVEAGPSPSAAETSDEAKGTR